MQREREREKERKKEQEKEKKKEHEKDRESKRERKRVREKERGGITLSLLTHSTPSMHFKANHVTMEISWLAMDVLVRLNALAGLGAAYSVNVHRIVLRV